MEKSEIKEKWGDTVVKYGWTAIPNLLIHNQGLLGISSRQLNTLITIMSYWWYKEKLAYPSVQTIADMMGKTPRSVQHALRELSKARNPPSVLAPHLPKSWNCYLKIIRTRKENSDKNNKNRYDFTPLAQALLAIEKLHQKQEREEMEKNKSRPRIPRIQ